VSREGSGRATPARQQEYFPVETYRSLKPDLGRHKGRRQSNQGKNQHYNCLHCVFFRVVEDYSFCN
jgi:hypothetical protein